MSAIWVTTSTKKVGLGTAARRRALRFQISPVSQLSAPTSTHSVCSGPGSTPLDSPIHPSTKPAWTFTKVSRITPGAWESSQSRGSPVFLRSGADSDSTLFHWDTPLAVQLEYGGFASDRIVDDYVNYAVGH